MKGDPHCPPEMFRGQGQPIHPAVCAALCYQVGLASKSRAKWRVWHMGKGEDPSGLAPSWPVSCLLRFGLSVRLQGFLCPPPRTKRARNCPSSIWLCANWAEPSGDCRPARPARARASMEHGQQLTRKCPCRGCKCGRGTCSCSKVSAPCFHSFRAWERRGVRRIWGLEPMEIGGGGERAFESQDKSESVQAASFLGFLMNGTSS